MPQIFPNGNTCTNTCYRVLNKIHQIENIHWASLLSSKKSGGLFLHNALLFQKDKPPTVL